MEGKIPIIEVNEQVRRIGNSDYVCIPRYLTRSLKLIPGDPVRVTIWNDGKLEIAFVKEEEHDSH